MQHKDIKEGDIIKFDHNGFMIAGQVIHVTDYDTVNVVPFDLKFVWSVQVCRVGGVLRKGSPDLTVEQLETFMKGVHLMLDMDEQGIKIVETPPSPTIH